MYKRIDKICFFILFTAQRMLLCKKIEKTLILK